VITVPHAYSAVTVLSPMLAKPEIGPTADLLKKLNRADLSRCSEGAEEEQSCGTVVLIER